ncbi:CzcE family metal-binding protein [Cupriavidus necator]|uniref:CzcE family metal-binding protein n=1 Tax=Cupriavidus necator TaxID=106590 RepID=UPI00339D4ABF
MTPTQRAALFGSPAPVPTATRTITLASGMKYVNVNSGETVAFKAEAQTVAWTFLESIQGTSVRMSTILPDIPESQGIWVHVSRSKLLTP